MTDGIEERIKRSISLNINDPERRGSLVRVSGEQGLVIVGDLHGEPDSLRTLRSKITGKCIWIFLGDYVDRGPGSIEILSMVVDMQLYKSDRVVLLRGNHEDWNMNLRYGFADEIARKGYRDMIPLILDWYESLPLFAVSGDLVAVHGGPPFPSVRSLKELEDTTYLSKEGQSAVWSDPLDRFYQPRGGGTRAFSREEYQSFLEVTGCSYMVRGHQYNPEAGYKVNFDNCLTLFSARYGREWKRSFLHLDKRPLTENIADKVIIF